MIGLYEIILAVNHIDLIFLLGWVGELCNTYDARIMQMLSTDILNNDYPSLYKKSREISPEQKLDIIAIPTLYEADDFQSSLLEAFLQVLNSSVEAYLSREMTVLRGKMIINLDVHVGFITKKIDPSYLVEKHPGLTAKQQIMQWFDVHPHMVLASSDMNNISDSFHTYHIDVVDPYSDADFGTIFYVRMGSQWIIWMGMEVSSEDERNLELFVEQYLSTPTYTSYSVNHDAADEEKHAGMSIYHCSCIARLLLAK